VAGDCKRGAASMNTQRLYQLLALRSMQASIFATRTRHGQWHGLLFQPAVGLYSCKACDTVPENSTETCMGLASLLVTVPH
jgi:hypothetical protein